eukprot:3940802-Rhodomonas_salina.2
MDGTLTRLTVGIRIARTRGPSQGWVQSRRGSLLAAESRHHRPHRRSHVKYPRRSPACSSSSRCLRTIVGLTVDGCRLAVDDSRTTLVRGRSVATDAWFGSEAAVRYTPSVDTPSDGVFDPEDAAGLLPPPCLLYTSPSPRDRG